MSKIGFQFDQHPWLSLLTIIITEVVAQALCAVIVVGVVKLPRDAPLTGFLITTLAHVIALLVVVPFMLRLPSGARSFQTYLDDIRLSQLQPLVRLVLLGLSCYLILALCQASGVLVYRVLEGKPLTGAFLRSLFDLSGDLPPKSWSLLVSLPSIFEEVAFRGVVLALFLSYYSQPKAVVFAALGFGAMHLLNLAAGRELAWVLGQAVWATILGLFYGYLVLKSGSLLPAMLVHYLSNLFIGSLTAYLQSSASLQTQVVYGILFSFGLVPTTLMILWVWLFTKLRPIV